MEDRVGHDKIRLLADAYTPFIDDPEPTRCLFGGGQSSAGQNQTQDLIERLLSRPKNPDAAMTAWRIGSDVGEVQIERDQNPIFQRASRQEGRIPGTSKPLGAGCFDIVPELA